VAIAYVKNGTDGINVYGRYAARRCGRCWAGARVRLFRPPPTAAGRVREDREYRAFHMLDDEQVGQASAIATITTRE
jgi:hypothetical protein